MTVTTSTRHSERLIEIAMPTWQTILGHPFLRELRDDSLPMETFRFYLEQDWLYIQERIGEWALVAGRCQDQDVRRRPRVGGWQQPVDALPAGLLAHDAGDCAHRNALRVDPAQPRG